MCVQYLYGKQNEWTKKTPIKFMHIESTENGKTVYIQWLYFFVSEFGRNAFLQ